MTYELALTHYITDPEDWSEEKTRNETDIIKSRLRKTIEQRLEGAVTSSGFALTTPLTSIVKLKGF